MSDCVLGEHVTRKGYVYVYLWLDGRRKQVLGHRLAWEQAHGPIPSGMHVHHVCENKACVNVEHLSLETERKHRTLHRLCDHTDRRYQANGASYCRVCKAAYDRRKRVRQMARSFS